MQNVFVWAISNISSKKYRFLDNTNQLFNLLKLQIHNCLDLNWNPKDIILLTNFPFKYMEIGAHEIKEDGKWSGTINKMLFVQRAIKQGIINTNFWIHDVDAFQMESFDFPLKEKDIGFVQHTIGKNKKFLLQGASVFYSQKAFPIVNKIVEYMNFYKPSREEKFLSKLFLYNSSSIKCNKKSPKIRKLINLYNSFTDTKNQLIKKRLKMEGNPEILIKQTLSINNVLKNLKKELHKNHIQIDNSNVIQPINGIFKDNYEWLNPTYNFSEYKNFKKRYDASDKPIKVVHMNVHVQEAVDRFCHGINIYNTPVINERFKKLYFEYYPEQKQILKKEEYINL